MDLQHQEAIKRLAEQHGRDQLLVVLGSPSPESAELYAETVVVGDPSYAGPLTEAQLGLDVYHVLEEEVRRAIPEDIWEEQVGVMADVLDGPQITAAVKTIREKGPGR